ncbi:MAG: hypothetical protein KAG61_11780 [Bacteriovoracaceae bacterium]|nr:hypothetical protein [Bacteriovoracaceae bacterium]
MTDSNEWKNKVQDLLGQFQEEVKKTTQIGMKMLSASKTNSCLNKLYEELGELSYEALKSKKLHWESDKVTELVNTIDGCIVDLTDIDKEVTEIKKTKSEENMEV